MCSAQLSRTSCDHKKIIFNYCAFSIMNNRMANKLISVVSLIILIYIISVSAEESSSQWIEKGRDFYNASQYDDAIDCYEEAIALEPENEVAWFDNGLALQKEGRYDDAINAFNKAIEIDPQDADSWVGKGSVLNDQGKYDEAIQCYDRAIEIDPQDALAWSNKGIALDDQSKYDEAIQACDKAIELDSQNNYAWINKGLALYRQGKYDEAIQCYDRAIEIDPQYALAWSNKGVALDDQGKYDEAIQCYDHVIEIDPQDTDSWNLKLNIIAGRKGKIGDALTLCNKALEMNPESSTLLDYKGEILYCLGDYEEALTYYNKALEIELDPTVFYDKGLVLKKLKHNDESAIALSKANELGFEPGNYLNICPCGERISSTNCDSSAASSGLISSTLEENETHKSMISSTS